MRGPIVRPRTAFSGQSAISIARQCGEYPLDLSGKTPEEKKTILLVESAVESGRFEEMGACIPALNHGEVRERFGELLKKKQYRSEEHCCRPPVCYGALGLCRTGEHPLFRAPHVRVR